jgi:putative transposase
MLEIQNDQPNDDEVERSDIITELSASDKEVLELIQKLLEPCDRKTYGERQTEVAAKLGKSVRTVRRLVKKWEERGLAALQPTQRADKGKHRIDSQWQKFWVV